MAEDRLRVSEQYKTLFADQVISVLKLAMDRISDADATLLKFDIGETLGSLARFLHQGHQKTSDLRIKTRFCTLVEIILQKRAVLRIRQEITVRNSLLDIIADWILEFPSVRFVTVMTSLTHLMLWAFRNGQRTSLHVTRPPVFGVTLI